MQNIYVGNLNIAASEEGLWTLFAGRGAVETVMMVRERASGQSRGFAFVGMTDAGQAEKAIRALDGTLLGGRTLNVSEALPKLEPGRGHDSRGLREHRRHQHISGWSDET
jgi:cold-inducible RNA-binding protein